MEALSIIILVILIILGLYLALLITDIVFVLTFRSIFKKHNYALIVLLYNKYDNVSKLYDLVSAQETSINKEMVEKFKNIDTSVFKCQESTECVEARNALSFLRDELVFFINKNPSLLKRNDIKQIRENIVEMDADYRKLIAMYNADVFGYNYWINFLPTRYIYKWLKVKPKQIIS